MTEFRPDPFDRPAPQPAPEGGGMIGRRLVLALVGLGAVAVAAAGIWFAYDQGVKRGAGGGPMLIKADNGPVKTAPENPGGMQVPNQDKQVFERLTGRQMGQGTATVENLLPPPEQPVPQQPLPADPAPAQAPVAPAVPGIVAALPPATPQAAPATPAAPAAAAPAAPATAAKPAANAPAATAPAAAAPPAVAAAPLQPVTPAPAAQSAPASAQQQTAAAGPRQLTVPTTPAPAAAPATTTAAATPAPKAAAATPAAGGSWRIQLSSVRSEADADKEWRRLKGKHPDPLNPLSARYVRVDLGEKGIWWRVQAGPVGDKPAAEAACTKLKAQGQGCTVVQ